MNEVNLGATVIMSLVQNHRTEVVTLLLRNGIVVPTSASDLQVAQLIVELLKKSKNFYEEFMALLSQPNILNSTASMSGYSNMSGSYANATGSFNSGNFTVPSLDLPTFGTGTTTTGSTTTSGTTPPKTSTLDKALGLFQFGVNAFLSQDKNKTDKALADASIVQSNNAVTLAELGKNPDGTLATKSYTTTYIVVGVSVVVVGAIAYFLMKNK